MSGPNAAMFDKWDRVLENAYHAFGNQAMEHRALLNLTRKELRELETELASKGLHGTVGRLLSALHQWRLFGQRLPIPVNLAIRDATDALNASGTLTEGGDVEQAPGDSLSGPTAAGGDAQ